MREIEKYDMIKRLFDAEPLETVMSEEDEKLLEKRTELEQNLALNTIQGYVNKYDLICEYGLQDVIMNNLKWQITHAIEDNSDQFLNSIFHQKFGEHPVIQNAIHTYNLKQQGIIK